MRRFTQKQLSKEGKRLYRVYKKALGADVAQEYFNIQLLKGNVKLFNHNELNK